METTGQPFLFQGQRVMENPVEALQLVNPLITTIVLGTPQVDTFPGSRILKPITAPRREFSYPIYGTERFVEYDTHRGLRAPYMHAEFGVTSETASLKRFGFASMRDVDEIENADSFIGLAAKSSLFAKTIVDMHMERIRRDLISTATNYPAAHRLAIGAGSEWGTAGGDFKANMQSMIAQICSVTGLQPVQLKAFLPFASYEAAKKDVPFLAARVYQSANPPTLNDLAEYVGMAPGSIWTANPIQVDAATGAVEQMYGDVAIIYYDGGAQTQEYDTTWGDYTFGVEWKWNRGVASEPWYDRMHSSWMFPWDDYGQPALISTQAGAIITNCAP